MMFVGVVPLTLVEISNENLSFDVPCRHTRGVYAYYMVEIRIHGRGGQGVVTAADLVANAAFAEGRYAQAFPSFGSERTGAPVGHIAECEIRKSVHVNPYLNPISLSSKIRRSCLCSMFSPV